MIFDHSAVVSGPSLVLDLLHRFHLLTHLLHNAWQRRVCAISISTPADPEQNRPPLSIEATSFAVWIVSLVITKQMPVATFSRSSRAAATANVTNGSTT